MGNSRSFRRGLKAGRHVRPSGPGPGGEPAARRPWNKGIALTSTPSLSTTRRWLEANVAEGLAERRPRRTGKRGRPAIEYRITEKGRRLPAASPAVARIQAERLRRWENAKKLRAQVRADRSRGREARQRRALAARERAVADERHRVLLARMILDASKALIEADGDASAVNAEEARVLTENGLAAWDGGRLVLAGDWLEAFREVLRGPAAT
jgi:hypothetical protein